MLRRRDPRIEERLIGDALSEYMDRVDTGRDLWPTISERLSQRKRTRFPKIAAVAAATAVVSLLAFLAVVRPWSNFDYQVDSDYSGWLPPCTPLEGLSSDPCEPVVSIAIKSDVMGTHVLPDEPRPMSGLVTTGDYHATHLVVRATYLPDTVRCTTETGFFRPPPYGEDKWWYSSNTRSVYCYADVRVNDYIVGSGPTTLTVITAEERYGSYMEPDALEDLRVQEERRVGEWVLGGVETVILLGPSLDAQMEAWEVWDVLDIERQGSTVVVVHPLRDMWRDARPTDYQTYRSTRMEVELPAFKRELAAAHQARLTANGGRTSANPDFPMLVTNANGLTQFFRSIGAYDHPDGPPVQPPPACGLALPGTDYNNGFMRDCQALLAAKDGLRGTATLNWDTGTTIGSWDGLTTAGTPTRVTKVLLPSKSLTGTIPASLGDISELTHLDLSSNSLTGPIPMEIGQLDDLVEVRLSGNSLAGCIPYGLKDVQTNDLASLNLLYCLPASDAPTAGVPGTTTMPLSWTAVANTTKYRVEYRKWPFYSWTLASESITTTSHTVTGLLCETDYHFRVAAYGDGTTYGAVWSDPSDRLDGTTGSCVPPRFSQTTYRFSVTEDAEVGASVGTVSTTDETGEPVTYKIRGWDVPTLRETWFFVLDEETGVFTVDRDLSGWAGTRVPMSVVARDVDGGESTVRVTIEVTES